MSEYSDEQDYERHLVSLDSLPLHNQATRYYGPIGEPVHRDTLRSDWPRLMDPRKSSVYILTLSPSYLCPVY